MFSQALSQAWQEKQPLVMAGTAGPGTAAPVTEGGAEACGPDGCAI
jgi:2-methylisocitrate lyase-like PEP mutase family enzyme